MKEDDIANAMGAAHELGEFGTADMFTEITEDDNIGVIAEEAYSLEGNEQYRMQMLAIGLAASGNLPDIDKIHEEYKTPVLAEVFHLRQLYEEFGHTDGRQEVNVVGQPKIFIRAMIPNKTTPEYVKELSEYFVNNIPSLGNATLDVNIDLNRPTTTSKKPTLVDVK